MFTVFNFSFIMYRFMNKYALMMMMMMYVENRQNHDFWQKGGHDFLNELQLNCSWIPSCHRLGGGI